MNGLVSKMSKYTKICHHKLPEPKMSSENCFFCPVECLKFKGNQFRIIQKREAVTLRAKEAGPNCRRISGGRFIRNQQQERANATDQHWGRAEDRTQTQTGLTKMRRRWREAETHRWGEGCDETREEIRDHEADAGQVWRGAQEHGRETGKHLKHLCVEKITRYLLMRRRTSRSDPVSWTDHFPTCEASFCAVTMNVQ